jgi:hypothetical protein
MQLWLAWRRDQSNGVLDAIVMQRLDIENP